jgi:hypothetical protein
MARQKSESLGKAVPFINTLATNITKRDIQHAYQIISTVVTRMIQEAESFIHDEMKKARSDEDYRALLEAQSRVRSEAHWINDAMLNLSGLLESECDHPSSLSIQVAMNC